MADAPSIDPLWKQMLAQQDQLAREYYSRLNALAGKTSEAIPELFYSEPTETLHSPRHKVVRVDIVIEALNILTARLALRTLPTWWQAQVESIKTRAAFWLTTVAAKKLVQFVPFAGQALSYAATVLETVSLSQYQARLEHLIRAKCFDVRDELGKLVLSQSSPFRRVHDVHTRHYSEPKKRSFKGAEYH